MNNTQLPYEVETRFHFESFEEACRRIPFLPGVLDFSYQPRWDSRIFGKDIFLSGRLLRIGVLSPETEPEYFLCLKGPDIGSYVNIRQELDANITAGEPVESILEQLGGDTDLVTAEKIETELNRLGHFHFMSFGGVDTYGRYESYGIDIKLMESPYLPYPLMVEFEKIAASETEALAFEEDLKHITGELGLDDVHLKDEPPTLLYKKLFG